MELKSTLTCPYCGFKKEETMPVDACVYKYTCTNCKKVITPKEGDCCVFCSYGSSKCPSKQMKKDVFITSTLKSERNLKFNSLLCQKLEEKGITCHLPQRNTKQDGTELDKFIQNIAGIQNSDKILAIGMNESINRGLEVGYSFGSKKKIILLANKEHTIPTMSLGMYYKVLRVDDLNNIESYINDLVHILN